MSDAPTNTAEDGSPTTRLITFIDLLGFVADDLLLNLDNKRTLATVRTLHNLAEDSQVLFFTHHEHIAALARASLLIASMTEHRL
ncbi:MAG: hypothetical protein WCA81_14280 [Rhizomicrobium sp.]